MLTHIASPRALVALVASLLLTAGCGVANPFSPSNASAKSDAEQLALKFAQCMRAHGVDVSDPDTNGGVRITAGRPAIANGSAPPPSPDTQAPSSDGKNPTVQGPPPEVQAAMEACKQYSPKGGRNSGPPSQAQIDAATKFAQCMRDHGIQMQDPQVTGDGGMIQSIGGQGVDPNSDQFANAQKACQHFMDDARPKGGQGGGATRTNG
jgi:hypothetical protein